MKSILIARVSTEEQREAGNSLPAQIARLEKYCQNKGFPILQVFSFDESAHEGPRDEFNGIIDFVLAQKEKIAVCCDKVDRLSRNIFDKKVAILYEKALQDKLELHFVSDGQVLNSRISAVEKFQFSISLGLAKYYSDAISDNVKRAQEQKLRKGEWLSKAPYGYLNITKEDGTTDIIVDDYTSAIIKKIFELYATKAYSIETLSQKLKADFNIQWSKSYFAKVLGNSFYHGEMLIKGKLYPHRYPPLISKTLFEEVKQVKDGFNKKPFKYAGLPYMYRGLLRCGHCGCSITPEKHKGFTYYHCTQYKGKHGAKWLREEEITEQLGQVFKSLQLPEATVQKITDNLNELHKDKIKFHNQQFDKLTNEQKITTKMMDNLYLDKLKGKISDEQYDKFYQSLSEQSENLNMRLLQLREAEDNYYTTAKYVLDISNRAYEWFVSSEVNEKRQLINLVLSNLRIENEKVLYDAQRPFDVIINSIDNKRWLGRKDSNLRMPGPKPGALPLGDAPRKNF